MRLVTENMTMLYNRIYHLSWSISN